MQTYKMNINKSLLGFLAACIFITSSGFILIKKKKTKKTAKVNLVKKKQVVKNNPGPFYDTSLLLIVDKSDYELKVYDKEGWLVTYPVVFGNKSLADKKMEGDKCTPEGTFRIIHKNPNHKWNKFILIDFPNADSYRKFEERKRNGEIPQDARIGGEIGIHGTFPDSDFVVNQMVNWTMGCISMRNEDITELFEMLPLHAKLIIQK
jgi:murein L,D-transpeptidase YafK